MRGDGPMQILNAVIGIQDKVSLRIASGQFQECLADAFVEVVGLGFQLEIAASFAVLIVLSLLGLVFYGATSLLEAKVVYWRGRT